MTPSPIRDAVWAVLKKNGPMHIYRIADALEDRYTVQQIRGAIGNARVSYPGQLFRVTRWITKEQDSAYPVSHLMAVFAAGKGQDAPKPVLTPDEKKARNNKKSARWREKNNSVVRARNRARYAKSKGKTAAQINPWAALARNTTAGATC